MRSGRRRSRIAKGWRQSLTNAAQRYIYYERQLGKQESEIVIPELDALDAEGLTKFKFTSSEPDMERATGRR